MSLGRTLEPEVMDTVEEAVDYDSMDHSTVNHAFVQDLLQVAGDTISTGTVIDVGALVSIGLIRSGS